MENVILFGIGGMLLFAIGVIVFVLVHQRRVIRYQLNLQKLRDEQQKLLLHAAIESEEKERQRIAGDLHDEVGASLAAVRLYLLRTGKGKTTEQAEAAAGAAKELLDEAVARVRRISHRLSPEMLMQFGLKDTLQHMAQTLGDSGGITVSFHSPEQIPRLHPDRELAVYRIIQEIIGNLLKHAAASEISIRLSIKTQRLVIVVEDNGKGFSQASFERSRSTPGGLGLKNIQSRADILQANINFTRAGNHAAGTVMTLSVPVE